jgi:succinate dehydrogenase / fumarate reductase flavoprotein subunit
MAEIASKNGVETIDADVLIIGGGIAGLWSAIRAKPHVERVLIVDKASKDWGGQASKSGGAMLAAVPPDTPQDFLEDLVYYYDGLCDQELWQYVLERSYGMIQEFQRLGYDYITHPDGRLKGFPQRALDHIKCYLGNPFGMGGINMIRALVNEAERLGIERRGRIMITELCTEGETIQGAAGFDTRTGQFYLFRSPSVVLAVGDGGWKTSYHHNTGAGDTAYLGLRSGAQLTNCEFVRVWNVPKLFAWEGQTYLLPLGAKFVNAKGESFMDRYSPVFGGNTDPHYVTRAMAFEARKGNGPFFLDCSGIKPDDRELVTPKGSGWMELNYLKLKKLGMSFFEDKIEWIAQTRRSVMGVHADVMGRTCVPGLFVAGRARAVDPTVYIGGLSLCFCPITGAEAGTVAGTYAAAAKSVSVDASWADAHRSQLFAPSGKPGIKPSQVLREIQEAVFPYDVSILKCENGLKRALTRLEHIREERLPLIAAPDAHYLMKLMEVKSIAVMSEIYVRASLERTESRAGHFREDFPARNDADWMCRILVSSSRNRLQFTKDVLPVERYPVKPTRYYSDNFIFPESAQSG